ncbi:MAG TPA: DinB family protein [Planctomycetaceae bacterium]|nr:DinB family protein [Planctomycetaceae bacterium]
MSDKSLLTLWDEVRGKTLAVLGGVSEQASLWAPPGLHNSIRWHAGHCYVMVERLCASAIGNEPVAPEGWIELFSWDSRPQDVAPEQWPALQSIVEQLVSQHRRLHATFARLTDDELEVALPASRHQTVRRKIIHALHDEACHCGEMWLLRKMLVQKSKRRGPQ